MTYNNIKKPPERCPECDAPVVIKTEGGGHRLILYNLDDSQHRCENGKEFEKHPIGKTVIGKKVERFELRGRRLTITLDDGNVLSVYAAGRPLTLRLEGPGGIVQE